MIRLARWMGLSLLCWIGLSAYADPAEAEDPEPVWVMAMEGDRPVLLVNRFADPSYGKEFPVEVVLVKKWVTAPGAYGVDNALLPVASDGNIDDRPMTFGSSSLISREQTSVLADLSSTANKPESTLGPTTVLALPRGWRQRLKAWNLSPCGHLAIVNLGAHTLFMDPASSKPLADRPFATRDVTFAKNAEVLAGVEWAGDRCRIAQWRLDGSYVYEGSWFNGIYSQLYLFPSGAAVMFTSQDNLTDAKHTLTLDFGTGETWSHEGLFPDTRHHSEDGSTMVCWTDETSFGKSSFDVSDPVRPQLLGVFESSLPIREVAVSSDGSRIALGILREVPGRNIDIILLNRQMEQTAALLTDTELRGLLFVEEFLFVGMHSDPLSTPITPDHTQRVELYDFGP